MPRATTPTATAVSPLVNNTPVHKKASGSNPYTSLHHVRDFRMRQMGAEMEGKFMGPMPPNEFLDTYFPLSTTRMYWTQARMSRFEKVGQQTSEKTMYGPLVDAIQPLCPSLEIIDTHDYPDPASEVLNSDLLKPDISIYPQGAMRDRPTDFSLMETHIEVKFDENDDAFRDDIAESFEHDAEASKDTKGQITSYAVAQLATQFRVHIFTILVCGGYARLLRWDRSGAVVTSAFDYCDRYLGEFFWRYDQASPTARGMDLSVSVPSETEAELARQSLKCAVEQSLAKFAVHHDEDGKISYYIGGRPTFKANASPTGRATRTFLVYDLENKRVVFLKDTWRIDMANVVKEGEVYESLHNAHVSHIAPLLCAGDVPLHRTRTQDLSTKPWTGPIERSLRPHHHYRLVLGVVGRDLTSFDSTWEMVNSIRDAVQAHQEAYNKAQILHRDISVGNILIADDGHGLLIDWDLCKHVKDLNTTSRQSERTGTWQFMSAGLLMSSTPPVHTLADDLESFLHVLSWVALRFTPHNLDSKSLTDRLIDMFDHSYEGEDKFARGGLSKMAYLVAGVVPKSGFRHPILPTLLTELTGTCAVRYEKRPSDKELEAYHELQAQQSDMLQNPLVQNSAAAMYERKMAALQSSDWMMKTLDEALADVNAWPSGDRSIPNPLYQRKPRGRKRKSEDGDVMTDVPTQRMRFTAPIPEDCEDESQRT